MHKRIGVIAAILVTFSGLAVVGLASAAQPENPGCFGQARSAGVQALNNPGDPGWGVIASTRKGENSTLNAAYKENVCN